MQNEFITALGLAEWEEEVVVLLEKYDVPEVEELDEDEDDYIRDSKDHFMRFLFDNMCDTTKQIARKAEENFYLQAVIFHFDLRYYKKDIARVDIPWGIDEKSDYSSVIATIGEPHFEPKKQNLTTAPNIRKFWVFKKADGEKYEVMIRFVNDESLKVHQLTVNVYREDRTYDTEIPHSYDPLKR